VGAEVSSYTGDRDLGYKQCECASPVDRATDKDSGGAWSTGCKMRTGQAQPTAGSPAARHRGRGAHFHSEHLPLVSP
jgi:hypothetical protein